MIVTVDRAELARAAGFAARALPARPTMPALAGILLTPGDGTLAVSGGDWDTTATAKIDAETPAGAEPLLVPGALLAGWLATARGATVTLDHDPDRRKVVLSSGSRIRLPTMDVADAPARPAIPAYAQRVTVPRAALAALLRRVGGAVGVNPQLPTLTAIHVVAEGGTLAVSATNRYIIAQASAVVPEVPARFEVDPGYRVLADLLARLDGPDVTLATVGGVLWVSGATMSACVRLLDPSQGHNWKTLDGILARAHPGEAVVDSDALAGEAAALAKIAATAASKGQVEITAADGVARLSLYDTDVDVESPPVVWVGDPAQLVIDAGFLVAALAAVAATSVHVTGFTPGKPVRFWSPESTGVAVVMPIRT